jgi:hypothetical protein
MPDPSVWPRDQCRSSRRETIEWLLSGDASIRWQTKRDLLDCPPDEVHSERAKVATTGWGRRLLSCHGPGGLWGGGLYVPKWTSTTYTLLLLRDCGLMPGHARALRGVELLWDGSRFFDGGLTAAVSIDAPEACMTAMYVALAVHFGFRDQRADNAVEWLVENQLVDGGWNCRTVRFGDHHGSFHTSILALEALAEVNRVGPPRDEVVSALARGREFFLAHRLFKSHRTGAIVDRSMTLLSFPPRWHYDILRGLDHFAATDAPWDDRFSDAIEMLMARCDSEGRFPVQHKHAGKVWFDMEKTGAPSRWNTLRSLRVLRWAQRVVPLQTSTRPAWL